MTKRKLAHRFLNLRGWEGEGQKPREERYVLIAAPHTSNWDFPYMLAFAALYDIDVAWFGKHTLFRGPMGPIMKKLGGIPIRRHLQQNWVEHSATWLRERRRAVLAVPAEGTRSRVDHWRSGFLHIARKADVPIVLGYLDYARKRGGFGPSVSPHQTIRNVMDKIREFYADKVGKYPELFGPIRLRSEPDG